MAHEWTTALELYVGLLTDYREYEKTIDTGKRLIPRTAQVAIAEQHRARLRSREGSTGASPNGYIQGTDLSARPDSSANGRNDRNDGNDLNDTDRNVRTERTGAMTSSKVDDTGAEPTSAAAAAAAAAGSTATATSASGSGKHRNKAGGGRNSSSRRSETRRIWNGKDGKRRAGRRGGRRKAGGDSDRRHASAKDAEGVSAELGADCADSSDGTSSTTIESGAPGVFGASGSVEAAGARETAGAMGVPGRTAGVLDAASFRGVTTGNNMMNLHADDLADLSSDEEPFIIGNGEYGLWLGPETISGSTPSASSNESHESRDNCDNGNHADASPRQERRSTQSGRSPGNRESTERAEGRGWVGRDVHGREGGGNSSDGNRHGNGMCSTDSREGEAQLGGSSRRNGRNDGDDESGGGRSGGNRGNYSSGISRAIGSRGGGSGGDGTGRSTRRDPPTPDRTERRVLAAPPRAQHGQPPSAPPPNGRSWLARRGSGTGPSMAAVAGNPGRRAASRHQAGTVHPFICESDMPSSSPSSREGSSSGHGSGVSGGTSDAWYAGGSGGARSEARDVRSDARSVRNNTGGQYAPISSPIRKSPLAASRSVGRPGRVGLGGRSSQSGQPSPRSPLVSPGSCWTEAPGRPEERKPDRSPTGGQRRSSPSGGRAVQHWEHYVTGPTDEGKRSDGGGWGGRGARRGGEGGRGDRVDREGDGGVSGAGRAGARGGGVGLNTGLCRPDENWLEEDFDEPESMQRAGERGRRGDRGEAEGGRERNQSGSGRGEDRPTRERGGDWDGERSGGQRAQRSQHASGNDDEGRQFRESRGVQGGGHWDDVDGKVGATWD